MPGAQARAARPALPIALTLTIRISHMEVTDMASSIPMLRADRGRSILNPRHVARVELYNEEKPGSATGERRWKVVAFMCTGMAAGYVLGTGWMSDEEDARRLHEVAGELISGLPVAMRR